MAIRVGWGPCTQAISSSIRGYVFRKRPVTANRKTVNHGVVDSLDIYSEITDILEIEYQGIVNLKCVMFKCEWYNHI